ncbi:gamma-glutamylcyclotransferase family protein [Kitasatospora sp. NPDC059327]|uniref:gamma-glutamylcyclotransferase family protein n=1 Tax=Kitasatospora sp. NPDC059327 TaxID=3346803 RepID=UPI0036845E35
MSDAPPADQTADQSADRSAALPFFVYGTLRTGGRNHALHLAGRCADVRAAVLEGAALHDGPGFPYAAPDATPGRRIIGELITVRPGAYAAALVALDRLEDCRADGTGEYVRERLAVRTAGGGSADAWVYLAGPAVAARLRARPALIASGDWTRRDEPRETDRPRESDEPRERTEPRKC